MTALTESRQIYPISTDAHEKLNALGDWLGSLPQVELKVEHHLYAGCYSRTIRIPKDVIMVSVLIGIPTQLIVAGKIEFRNGEHEPVSVDGYQVFEGAPFRQMAAHALEDTVMTMFFATDAKTVEEAEAEFTPEPERLQSRRR